MDNRDKLLEKIRNIVLNNLGTCEYELNRWKHRPYLMDGAVVANFWDYVADAPAVRVVGDYDVDGVCATYIIVRAIQAVFPQKIIRARIPRRFSEGYGLSKIIADEIREKDPKGTLIITVDNGIAAGAILESLEADGYPVIITDHHELGKATIPNVRMVIDPKVTPLSFTGDYWCGAAVVYKLSEQVIADSSIRTELETYAAIATVADCVPLREGNWAVVRRALEYFRNGNAPWPLSLLSEMLGQEIQFCNEDTIGYYLGPAINSLGRLNDNGGTQALSYLLTPTIDKAKYIKNTNDARKNLRDVQYQMILSYIREHNLEGNCPIWVAIPDLHLGIVGILAGKIAEDFNVPSIILTNTQDGKYKGSARSVEGINIFQYLLECDAKFEALGGHAGAAGMTISPEEYEKARQSQIPSVSIKEIEPIAIEPEDIPYIYNELQKYVPFGEENPSIAFSVEIDMMDSRVKMVGGNGEHMIAEDASEIPAQWKITHFNHIPNDLDNKDNFAVVGNIIGSGFNGIETPTLNGKKAVDLPKDREGLGLEK